MFDFSYILMKMFFLYITLCFISNSLRAQGEVDLIRSYNKHIDPMGKLDTAKSLAMQIKSDIDYTLNLTSRQIHRVKNCSYYSDGSMKCINVDSNDYKGFDMPQQIPEDYQGSAIRFQLNYLIINEKDILSLKAQGDSITVVDREVIPSTRLIYTFDSKTKDLLQIKRIYQGGAEEYISFTNFKSYQTINGIVVPKSITFSNNFSTASVEYSAVEFK